MSLAATTSNHRRLGLIAATICTSAVGTTMGLVWPLLSLLLARAQADGALIGFNSAAQTAASLVIAPFAPRMFARWGMKRVIAACIVAILAALFLLKVFEDPRAWLAILFVLGGGVVVLFIGTQTWVNRLAPDHARGRIIGLFGFLWAAAYALGPLTLRVTGIEGWLPFAIAIGLVGLAGLPLLFVVDVLPDQSLAGGKRDLLAALLSFASPAFVASMALGCFDSVNVSFLPLYGLRNGLSQVEAVSLLLVLEVGVLASQLPSGWASDRMDRDRLLTVLAALALLASLMLPFGFERKLLLWPVLFLLGGAAGAVWTVSLVLVGQLFQNDDLSTASASRSVLYGIGSVIGPPVAGLAFDHWGRLSLPIVLSTVCAGLLVSCLLLRRPGGPGRV